MRAPGPCARCGREPALGYASLTVAGVTHWLCHPDDSTEPDCYAETPGSYFVKQEGESPIFFMLIAVWLITLAVIFYPLVHQTLKGIADDHVIPTTATVR